jgi:hypothetical protein
MTYTDLLAVVLLSRLLIENVAQILSVIKN